MGRFYSGDIEGKFWFAVQDSVDAQHFGGTMDYLDEEGEVWEDGDEGQPVEVAFNFGPNDHDSIQKGLKDVRIIWGNLVPRLMSSSPIMKLTQPKCLGNFWRLVNPRLWTF